MVNRKMESSKVDQSQTVTMVAWTAMLLTSNLTIIVWREFASGEPYWWPWLHGTGLVTLFAVTFVRKSLKPLQRFILVLLVIYFLGFGAGWQWGLIPFIRASSTWTSWENQTPWAVSAIATHLLRLSPALIIMLFLSITGLKRRDLFLVKGKINAPVEPSKLLGMKKPEPWSRIGSIFAFVFAVVTFAFLMLTRKPSSEMFFNALPLIPVALLIAAMNAFNEEFTLRASLLSTLAPIIGKQQALVITTVHFGLGHFYGVPDGPLGVLLSAFLGWFLGKSLLETKGFFWAWIIHFLPDVFIFTFYAMLAS